MTDYAKIRVGYIYSESSDYSDPLVQSQLDSVTLTPTAMYSNRVTAAVAGTSLDLSKQLATVTSLVIQNTSSSYFVTVGWDDDSAVANSNVQKVAAGRILVIPGIDPNTAVVLTANTATVICDIFAVGTSIGA